MTADMATALAALKTSAESNDGNGWWTVYLDNAHPKGWAPRKWRSILSALAKAGHYRKIDDPDFNGAFGQVKLTADDEAGL